MSATVAEFWGLLAESHLVAAEQLERFQKEYAGLKGAGQAANSSLLAEWLISQNAITRYHCDILRGGRSGPFRFGDYQITNRIANGRLAGQFSARHLPTGCEVLLCFLTGTNLQNKPQWRAVAQQAEIARRMIHPNLLRVFELLDLVTYKLVAVEPLAGQSLAEILAGGKRLSEADACRITRFVASALAHLHPNHQIHGEVRPSNIWIDAEGRVKLLQPPLARNFDRKPGAIDFTSGSADRRALEAADYAAPELIADGGEASFHSDIYALGCTMYEMLAGRPPYAGATVAEKMNRHAHEAIAPLESFGVSPPLAQIVTYMMAKDPKMRYQKASILYDTLELYVEPDARLPKPPAADAARAAYEDEVTRRQVELRSLQRQFEAMPEVEGRFSRGPARAPSEAAAPAVDTGTPSAPAAPIALDFDSAGDKFAALRNVDKDGLEQLNRSESRKLIGYFAGGVALIVGGVLLLNYFRNSQPPTLPAAPTEIASASPDKTPPSGVQTPGAEPTTPATPPKNTPQPPQTQQPPTSPQQPIDLVRETKINDDGATLWASPTAGPPLDLAYLPPGPQIFVALRPASLLAHPEGEKVVAALGPRGATYFNDLKRITGFAPEEIELVIVGLQAGEIGELEASMVVHLVDPLEPGALVARWPNAAEAKHDGKSFYTAGPYAYYIPERGSGQIVSVTSPKYIRDVLLLDGAPLPLEREMERMLADTDAERDFTLLFPPKHIFGEAHKAVFAGATLGLKEPLAAFLGDESIKAALLSMHLDDNFFAELRVFGTLDIPPSQLGEQMNGRLAGVPRQIRRLIASTPPYPYSIDILAEFPEMIRVLGEYTRGGVEHDQAVLRAYLPAYAAHNLLMGAELAMSQHSGGPAGPVVAAGPAKPQTIADLLQKKTSLSFDRDTLEQSLRMLSEEIGVEITILGGDLQLDGITKNQSFGIDLRDQPAKKILEQILVLANPDKTATGPDDLKQKLVYIIQPKDGKDAIFVTTRAQVEKRGDKLPAEFVAKEAGKK